MLVSTELNCTIVDVLRRSSAHRQALFGIYIKKKTIGSEFYQGRTHVESRPTDAWRVTAWSTLYALHQMEASWYRDRMTRLSECGRGNWTVDHTLSGHSAGLHRSVLTRWKQAGIGIGWQDRPSATATDKSTTLEWSFRSLINKSHFFFSFGTLDLGAHPKQSSAMLKN
jgi:hypothetical protein